LKIHSHTDIALHIINNTTKQKAIMDGKLQGIEQNKVKKYAEIMAIATLEHAYRDQNVKWTDLSEGLQTFLMRNCMPAAEAIVKHLQSLALVDVDDEILWQYPIEQEMYKFPPTCKYLGEEVTALQEAARYGASLADRKKAIAFSVWCADSEKYMRVTDEQGNLTWIDQDTPEEENGGDYYRFTTEQLYEIFETDYLKNTNKHEK
jgi:hypothetical protein